MQDEQCQCWAIFCLAEWSYAQQAPAFLALVLRNSCCWYQSYMSCKALSVCDNTSSVTCSIHTHPPSCIHRHTSMS